MIWDGEGEELEGYVGEGEVKGDSVVLADAFGGRMRSTSSPS